MDVKTRTVLVLLIVLTHCHPHVVCQNAKRTRDCDLEIISNNFWLTDKEMGLAAQILSKGSPDVGGLQDPVLGQKNQ